jgi:hypothetical protein
MRSDPAVIAQREQRRLLGLGDRRELFAPSLRKVAPQVALAVNVDETWNAHDDLIGLLQDDARASRRRRGLAGSVFIGQ